MEDFLTVLDLNAQNYVHRIELTPPSPQRLRILQTQITATNDLFALTLQEDKYRVFMINLDASDLSKLDELKSDPERYSMYYEGKRKPVLEYDVSDV